FIQRTTNITNITIINNRVVNRGIDVGHVERETHRHIERFAVADTDRPARTQMQGNRVVIYRPTVVTTGNQKLRHQNLQNNGAPAQEFGNQQEFNQRHNNGQQQFVQPQPTVGTNEQPQVLKKNHNNGQQQFVQPQPTVGTNEQPQVLKKNHNNGQQQFVQPQPTVGTNEQPQVLKKKHNYGQQQQFFQPQEMQPSAGGTQQPYVLKHRNNGQQEFAFPNNDGQGQPQL